MCSPIVIAVSRKTRSGAITSFGGMINYAPGLTALMTFFLASLAGIPPFGGWFAKLSVFRAVLEADTGSGYAIAIIGAVNTVIAFGYYGRLMREMWMKPVPDGDMTPVRVPSSLSAALGITAIATLVLGILPQLVLRFGDLQDLTGAFGGDEIRAAIAAAGGAITFETFMDARPLRRGRLLHQRWWCTPAVAVTSSPAPRSDRCSAPCSRGARRVVARARLARAVHVRGGGSRSGHAGARRIARRPAGVPRCAHYVAVEVSTPNASAIPIG